MTTPQPRILFDECISKPAAMHLAAFFERDKGDFKAEIGHLFDLGLGGQWDEVWIPKIADQGWIVISADRGMGGIKKGQPFPRVCLQYGVTHILLTQSVHARTMFDKILTLMSLWHEILTLRLVPGGSRYRLEPINLTPAMKGRGRLVKKHVEVPTSLKPPPEHLFPP